MSRVTSLPRAPVGVLGFDKRRGFGVFRHSLSPKFLRKYYFLNLMAFPWELFFLFPSVVIQITKGIIPMTVK